MIPKSAAGIGHIASRLVQDLMPRASDAYMATDLAYLSVLLAMVAQDYDRAADVLVAEERELVAILRDAAPHVADEGQRAKIERALKDTSASLRVNELTARSDALLRLLIEVHEFAEADGAAWARELNDSVWKFLEAYAARRAYEVPV